ncbi:MAG: DNA-protecting protein DprA, partial [Rhodocyclaceae bacterium]|nr:DNA-protecting protein DprA [Rhodocyclaceae bacterium]
IRQGACLAESVHDVLQEMQWEGSAPAPATTPAAPSPAAPEAGNDDDALLHALGADPVSLDALQARTGWPTEQLQVRLLELELAGQLARLPGGLFQRTASA